MNFEQVCQQLRVGANKLSQVNAGEKNAALQAVAIALDKNRSKILEANKKDIETARASGMKESLIDRLMLDDNRISSIIESIAYYHKPTHRC